MNDNQMIAGISSVNEKPLDLKKHLFAILKHKWKILFFALVITAVAVAFVLSKPHMYTAKATLMIEPKDSQMLSGDRVFGIDTSSSEYLLTQFEILKSNTISQEVIERLNLQSHKEFNPNLREPMFADLRNYIEIHLAESELAAQLGLTPKVEQIPNEAQRLAQEKALVLASFKSRLVIEPKRKTQLVSISFTSENAALAALIANELGTVYIENNLNAKFQMSKQASEWLGDRMQVLKNRLNESETKLQEFVRKEGLVESDSKAGVSELASRELNELTSKLNEAKNRRVAAASLYNLSTSAENDLAVMSTLPEITNHPLIRDLKLAEGQADRLVMELSQRYGPKHPRMQTAQAELRSTRQKLNKELNELLRGIKNEVTSARNAEAALSAEIQTKKNEYRDLSVKRTRYNELAREVDSNKQLYEMFMGRYKETTASSDFGATIANFTDKAVAPLYPSAPKRKLIVVLAFLTALGFGCVIAVIRDALNEGFVNVQQVEEGLGLNLLAALPKVKFNKSEIEAYLYFNEKDKSFAEGIRTVRTGYMLSNLNSDKKVVLVTSTVPSEGKSTCSTSLAFALSSLEKTLLIDADLRKPSLGTKFKFSGFQPGLANLIAGTHDLEDCLVHDRRSELDILPAGLIPPNPLDLFVSKRFEQILAMLKTKYDRIVIDSAPLQPVSDTHLLAQHCDSCILVIKAATTRQPQVKVAVGRLIQNGVRIDGVILNRMDLKDAHKYGDYQTYSDYYTQNHNKVHGKEARVA
ncbi:GumC family protein [Paraferrimonas haliotis]|uniref:non-specific protein-tyrosine kinase n=1 Tax=Paraferrimonas haliotis TaxID=2013866 RepID=A0AA37TMU7_9GAMM|nr:polysaccharide biosynthesis tyrosine autokinase [Paraferrimonas haliotis]GLS84599.1 chain-length determining protein [Paraferrimonas haliotis]